MSKKASVNGAKKSKRRLKRSVRRSIAALLMVTAIGVAAIPVPDNFAADPSMPELAEEGGSTTGGRQDVHTDFVFNEETVINTEPKDPSAPDLSKYANATINELVTAINNTSSDPRVYASYTITQVGDAYDLSWQFVYYVVGVGSAPRAVICKYNNEYMADEVELNMSPITKYYTLEPSKIIGWYNWTSDGQAGMDIRWNPKTEIKYTYADYDGNFALNEDEQYFVDNFDKAAYDNAISRFAAYKAGLADLEEGEEPGDVPEPYTAVPSTILMQSEEIVTENMLAYYSHYDLTFTRYTNYSWVEVIDDRIGTENNTGNRKVVYVARHSSGTAQPESDNNGFLVDGNEGRSVFICAIGDGAFKGASRVRSLIIPDQISYIGDEAFMNATLVTDINVGNVTQLGNSAFKGCTHLETVAFGTGLSVIGAECFRGDLALTEITLPDSVKTIGEAAFEGCRQLSKLDVSACNGGIDGCKIKKYAFYNCISLTDVNMNSATTRINTIEDGAFAVSSGGAALDITLPATATNLGDYIFTGRASLKSVTFPSDFGTGVTAEVPDNMFHGCVNLEYVVFPTDRAPYDCGYVTYDPKVLFADVVNEDFYVRGPELKNLADVADPRSCTWEAVTWVNNYVPYVFKNAQGVDCYEVAMDGYRFQANENNELTSCVLVNENATEGNLVIPSKVGRYDIRSIVPGCFGKGPVYSDEAERLRNSIKTITISDNSVSEIEDEVFIGLPNLEQVVIGNSVTAIGDRAFADCNLLVDVTFHSPANGYSNFTIGTDAFKTGGEELTFHGDIVKGYAPFDWAMEPGNMIDSRTGIRVCYISLTPTYLTVMYDANTGLVTLLDYPQYDQIDEILNDIHRLDVEIFYDDADTTKRYEDWMADTYYISYMGPEYDSFRTNFAREWALADTKEAAEALYESEYYGPWVNESFVSNPDNFDRDKYTDSANLTEYGNEDGVLSKVADFFFEPITAYAYEGLPEAFFTHFPYSAQDNADSNHTFRTITEEERGLINAAKNVVVPEGVDSIDVYGYINGSDANGLNAIKYLRTRISSAAYDMYTSDRKVDSYDNTDVVPGLFSGAYKDYADGSENEEYTRGNDRLETVTLTSVKFLPDHAFDSCEKLMSVIIGADCTDIGVVPFRGCTNLTNVNFNGNPKYVADNGIIYSRNTVSSDGNDGAYTGTYTIEECLYARGKNGGVGSTTIPDAGYNGGSESSFINSVEAIREGAFEECVNLNNVYLTDAVNLVEIPMDCFRNCTSLNRLWLPRSVNYIEEGAFAYDNNLTELRIPGKEVFISARAFVDAKESGKTVNTTIYTYPDSSARRYADKYGSVYLLDYFEIPDEWTVIFLDSDGVQIGDTLYKENGSYLQTEEIPAPPEKDGWVFQKWLSTNQTEVTSPITADTVFIAQGYSVNGMVDGEHYTVDFYDQIDGSQIGDTQYVLPGGAAIAPQVPNHEGYTFVQWSSDEYLNVQRNLSILAMYSGSGTGGSSTTNPSGSSTANGSRDSSNNNNNSSTSATSGSSSETGKYTVTVVNGSGSGTYDAGSTVIIAANTPASGKVFSKWTTDSQGVTLASVSMTATTFVMPANNVTVTANYVDGSTVNTVGGTVNNGTTSVRNTGTGSTRVDITKPGISNKDLATATVNGSTDNFVVKISETDEATQAVINALTNKYGNMESILYYAMDISLYDSTGTVKITDTTGLSVDITIPIPDALTVFGGNNMAGAVVANSQLEDLSERFTTINGVPCISFTATHFSPYTIYVDTQNLSEGMLDITPKTGDPIHPKWFLSLGLACLSIILFMKKDKRPVNVSAA